MAKKSSIARNEKRKRLVKKYDKKRTEIKTKIRKAVGEEQILLQRELAAIPKNAAPCRVRNRCELTGRPRGVYSKFKLSRNMLRILAMSGMVPGIVKSSW
jgi:small subunit ribosomal protein S14